MAFDEGQYFLTGELKKSTKRGKSKKRNLQLEDDLRNKCTSYLKKKNYYLKDKILFRVDVAADLRVSIGLAVKNKKVQMEELGYPDFFLAMKNKKYGGFYIEFKKDKSEVYKLNGDYKKNKHLEDQLKMHQALRNQGYKVEFAWNFTMFVNMVENYLKEI